MRFRCILFVSAAVLWAVTAPALTVLNANDSGAGSLRQAIIDAPAEDTITFTNTLAGQTIVLTNGQITVTNNLTIDASAIGGITIDGNGLVTSNRIFELVGSSVELDSLVLQNGLVSGERGGAISIDSGSTLTIDNAILSGNSADGGGGIYNDGGTLTLNNSTLSSNSVTGSAGSIWNEGTLTLNNSTLSGNSAANTGGAIRNNGPLTINNSTLSGNSAIAGEGGAIRNTSGDTITLNNATLSGNSATDGGGIFNGSGTLNAMNSIIAGNTAGSNPNIEGSISAGSNNLTSGNPQLVMLGDYGGPTMTMPPLPGSPAIDMGASTTLTNDQRGFARQVGSAVDIGAVEADHNPIVTKTADDGAGSLRQVIADALPGSSITFTNTLAGQTITLTSGQILIDENLTIDGSALTNSIIIDGNAGGRVFEFASATTNVLEALTLTNGWASGSSPASSGGAIYMNATVHLTLNNATLSGNSAANGGGIHTYDSDSTLILNNVTLSGNSATFGGGIRNNGPLMINNCTLSGNSATSAQGSGGGIYNSGTLTLNNSTLSGNSAGDFGGGILNYGMMTLNNCTLSGNTASNATYFDGYGGGIYNSNSGTLNNSTLSGNSAESDGGGILNSGALTLNNCIVAGNNAPSGPNVDGSISSGSNNLTSGDPLLAPLGDYGGPTQTMPPLPGSPAIDAGLTSATNSLTDQRGLARVINGIVDIGAVELEYLLVINTNDSGVGSLRRVIAEAVSDSEITFTNTLAGQTIVLTSGQITVDKNLTIDASLSGGITIDGNDNGRIFEFVADSTNVLDSLTLTNGTASNGGAIYANSGATLTLNNSTLSDNSASSIYEGGGGIYADLGCKLTLNNCTLSGNSSSSDFYGGGGIYAYSFSKLTLNNSTLFGNSSTYRGGGIYGDSLSQTTLTNSTLSGNTATDWSGGIYNGGSALNVVNSIIAGNTGVNFMNFNGSISSGSNNIISGDPLLWPLGDYGGPTQTMPPLSVSPAIDAGLTAATNSLTDQRGMTRVLAYGTGMPIVDIGAVEYNGWLVGEDVSGIDPAYLLQGTLYDINTVFPVGYDPSASGMVEILSQSAQDGLIAQGEANVTNNPVAYGLYTESAFQALALDRPFLSYNVASNSFTLTIGILQAPDLFTTFSNLTGFTTIPYPGDGEIDIEFEPPNSDARFFQVYGSEPPAP